MTQIKKHIQAIQARRIAAAAALTAAAASAHAELPSGITEAITAAGVDLKTAATAVVVSLIAFWAIRAVGRKMGWWAS